MLNNKIIRDIPETFLAFIPELFLRHLWNPLRPFRPLLMPSLAVLKLIHPSQDFPSYVISLMCEMPQPTIQLLGHRELMALSK